MSRRAKTKSKVTVAVTAPVQEPAFPITKPQFEDALDEAVLIGDAIGQIKGFDEGLNRGVKLPRTPGEYRAKMQGPAIARILQEVFLETKQASRKHEPMHGPHEGYAVIHEELDELWDEIKANRGKQASARAEAIQVAAMAVRYVLDIDPR